MKTAKVGDIWYRVSDPEGNEPFYCPRVAKYRVIRLTPCGVVLNVHGQEKRVLYPRHGLWKSWEELDDGGRRFAYPTLRMARWSWLYRKHCQAERLRAGLDQVNSWLEREKNGSLWETAERPSLDLWAS